jgi:hypothetical protein
VRDSGALTHISRSVFLSTAGSGALTLLGGQQPANAALRGIDHLTILFKELEPAIQAYRELGFTVVPGGGDWPEIERLVRERLSLPDALRMLEEPGAGGAAAAATRRPPASRPKRGR